MKIAVVSVFLLLNIIPILVKATDLSQLHEKVEPSMVVLYT
jgi:hypothetical protein